MMKLAMALVPLYCAVLWQCSGTSINQTNSPIPGTHISPGWNWGFPTNGICGEAEVIRGDNVSKLPSFDLAAVNTNKYGFFGEEEANNDLAWAIKLESGTCLFYAPTNLSRPVMELKGKDGKEVPSKFSKAASPSCRELVVERHCHISLG
jgi:hypothetical protein